MKTFTSVLLKINALSAFIMAMALDSNSYIPCIILGANLGYIALYMIINKGVHNG
jgi:hypothetical protein